MGRNKNNVSSESVVASADGPPQPEEPKFNFANLSLPSPLGARVEDEDPERQKILKKLQKRGAGYWKDKLDKAIKWTPRRIELCLDAIATTGVVVDGARAAGVTYMGLKQFIDRDPVMKIAVEEALEQHLAFVNHMVVKRGVVGWYEPITSKGGLARDHEGKVLYLHKYDQKVFEMWVKRHDRAFRERNELDVSLSTKGGVLVIGGAVETEEEFDKKFGKMTYDDSALHAKPLPVIEGEAEVVGPTIGRG